MEADGRITAQFISKVWWYFGFHNFVMAMLTVAVIQPKSLSKTMPTSSQYRDLQINQAIAF